MTDLGIFLSGSRPVSRSFWFHPSCWKSDSPIFDRAGSMVEHDIA